MGRELQKKSQSKEMSRRRQTEEQRGMEVEVVAVSCLLLYHFNELLDDIQMVCLQALNACA